ncbi:MAG TPA: class I SAM-dependent methyltransferase [Candidatus Eisenbacteria bacterium]|nr:class I SAM-dependent methyltransferase [Candidatus Eisenbacteria bacterium]
MIIFDCTCGSTPLYPFIASAFVYHRIVSSSSQPAPAHPEGPRAWVRETFRIRGFTGGLRYYAKGCFELLRDFTPARRRSRYGDIDYDFNHLVDTTWATVSLRTRIRELLAGGQYQPTEPNLFHQILHALPVSPEGFTFIDLGSGKGRTLLMASDYPFRRIVGVELLAEFEAIARQNIVRYHDEQKKCFALQSQLGDARDFVFPVEPTVVYLFNPFPEHVLRAVLANLRNSLTEAPRPAFVIYHNLVYERVLVDCEWLQAVYRTPQFAIYRALQA